MTIDTPTETSTQPPVLVRYRWRSLSTRAGIGEFAFRRLTLDRSPRRECRVTPLPLETKKLRSINRRRRRTPSPVEKSVLRRRKNNDSSWCCSSRGGVSSLSRRDLEMRPGLTKAREFVSGERGQRAAGEITTSLQKLGGGSIAIGRDNVLEFVIGQARIDLLNRTVGIKTGKHGP